MLVLHIDACDAVVHTERLFYSLDKEMHWTIRGIRNCHGDIFKKTVHGAL